MIRFFSAEALDLKAVNDDLVVNFTCSLPPNFAYVLSSMHYELAVDRAVDFESEARFRVFNGVPNAPAGNNLISLGTLTDVAVEPGLVPLKVLTWPLGSLRENYPTPIWRSPAAAGMSAILQVRNLNNTVQAAGTQEFHLAFYQYELNQAVRFPLNFPLPVGLR